MEGSSVVGQLLSLTFCETAVPVTHASPLESAKSAPVSSDNCLRSSSRSSLTLAVR